MTIESFGTLSDGTYAQLCTLTNHTGIQVQLTNFGATLVSLKVPAASGKLTDVVLGYDTLAEYVTESAYMGVICGRYANRIALGDLPIGDKRYEVDVNHAPHHLHGGKPGFNKVLWEVTDLSTPDQDKVEMTYLSPDGEAGFPGNVTVKVTFSLDGKGLQMDYYATTDAPTVINLANHAYFNLDGHDAGTVLDHQLQLHAAHMLETDPALIPTGKFLPVADTPFDFLTSRSLGERIEENHPALAYGSGYDHCLVVNDYDKSLRHVGTLANEKLRMHIHSTQPGIQVYTANHLKNVSGKGDAMYQPRHAVCLETQHFPDSPHHAHFPTTMITSERPYQETVVYAFE